MQVVLSLLGAAVVVGTFGAYWQGLPLVADRQRQVPADRPTSPLVLVLAAIAASSTRAQPRVTARLRANPLRPDHSPWLGKAQT